MRTMLTAGVLLVTTGVWGAADASADSVAGVITSFTTGAAANGNGLETTVFLLNPNCTYTAIRCTGMLPFADVTAMDPTTITFITSVIASSMESLVQFDNVIPGDEPFLFWAHSETVLHVAPSGFQPPTGSP